MAIGYVESQCDGYTAGARADVEDGAIGGTNCHMLCDKAAQVLGFWTGNEYAWFYVEGATIEVRLP